MTADPLLVVMTQSREFINFIGRLHPEIFDILGGPDHWLIDRGRFADLNPQPLPPGGDGFRSGMLAGAELARLAHHAEHLGAALSFDPDEICPRPPGRPGKKPFPWPPTPWGINPNEELELQWVKDYHEGLLFALDASAETWQQTRAGDVVGQIQRQALDNAAQLG